MVVGGWDGEARKRAGGSRRGKNGQGTGQWKRLAMASISTPGSRSTSSRGIWHQRGHVEGFEPYLQVLHIARFEIRFGVSWKLKSVRVRRRCGRNGGSDFIWAFMGSLGAT